jgi:Mn2+/Fe2+ NRAMP family transporter
MRSRFSSLVGLIYLVIGLIVASGHAYFTHLNAVMPILSAILAVVLWPLVLLGINLHIK